MTLLHVAAALLTVVLSGTAALHAVLTKREVRGAIGWVGLILVFPVAGPTLYFLFGVNRIHRRARGAGRGGYSSPGSARAALTQRREPMDRDVGMPPSSLAPLAYLVGAVVREPLVAGNAVETLIDGEEAYPAMLRSIGGAKKSIGLSTYIFDLDPSGQQFVDALIEATRRGVEVRVLVDAVGSRYSKRSVVRLLRKQGVSAALFMRSRLPLRWPYFNLRTHRKLLTIDGLEGYLGGMNLRQGHLVDSGCADPIHDVHFLVRGPVVRDMQGVFVGDWAFATREVLRGGAWFPEIEPVGSALARVVPDGPDEDLDKIRWTFLGALANARDSVRIQTPYFLPDTELLVGLQLAALRGIEVEILIPAENNLKFVQWAATSQLWQLIEHGCHVYLGQPPFDHSKVFVVDGSWALVGSANWDPRSLRLNFEIGLEIYDPFVVRRLNEYFSERRSLGRRVSLEELNGRPLWERVRDGIARLALPYL